MKKACFEFRRPVALVAVALLLAPGVALAGNGGLGPLVPMTETMAAADTARSSSGADRTGTRRYVYRNDGTRAVVTWDFRCISAMNDGRTGWTGKARDGFRSVTWPYLPGREEVIAESRIQPGEILDVGRMGGFQPDGPFAATACGLVAVVLDDGTSFGSPEILEQIFASRRALVADLEATLEGVDRILRDTPPSSPVGPGVLESLPGHDLYEDQLGQIAHEASRSGRLPATELRTLRDQIERNILEARRQIPPAATSGEPR